MPSKYYLFLQLCLSSSIKIIKERCPLSPETPELRYPNNLIAGTLSSVSWSGPRKSQLIIVIIEGAYQQHNQRCLIAPAN